MQDQDSCEARFRAAQARLHQRSAEIIDAGNAKIHAAQVAICEATKEMNAALALAHYDYHREQIGVTATAEAAVQSFSRALFGASSAPVDAAGQASETAAVEPSESTWTYVPRITGEQRGAA